MEEAKLETDHNEPHYQFPSPEPASGSGRRTCRRVSGAIAPLSTRRAEAIHPGNNESVIRAVAGTRSTPSPPQVPTEPRQHAVVEG